MARSDRPGAGAFLSGGLDSSTVSGLQCRHRGEPTPTFSIGFGEAGYDEIPYARIAARHFSTDPHEYYVSPEDVTAALPKIAAAYDEPFGNSSAIPTYFCARLARECGVDLLLAGDGGDEIFAGNERYAKQKVFELYHAIPAPLARMLVNPWTRLPGARRIPPLRKLASYVDQARIPLPERMQTYNFLMRVAPTEVFTPDFLGQVNPDAPLDQMRRVWEEVGEGDTLDRMLYLDWKYTLADNDLRKVTHMAELAGAGVRYPMLDDEVVELSLRVPSRLKLRGTRLRYFYKSAMRDFLPREILHKPKHGFGLPFGEWLKTSVPLQQLVYGQLEALKGRGIVQDDFLDRLIETHRHGHASYYGTMLWVFAMLEGWLSSHGH